MKNIFASIQNIEPWGSAFTSFLIAITSVFMSTSYRDQAWIAFSVLLIILLLLLILQTVLVRTRNKLGQGLIEREKTIMDVLEAAAKTILSIVGSDKHIRASIMLPSANRQTRKVTYRYGFSETDTDSDLELDIKLGNTGVAWRRRRPHYTDMAIAAKMIEDEDSGLIDYGLTAQQQKLVRPTLKSMISVPIFDPDKPDGQLLGTLSFDSDNTLEEMHFKENNIKMIAQTHASILSRLLKI